MLYVYIGLFVEDIVFKALLWRRDEQMYTIYEVVHVYIPYFVFRVECQTSV